MSFKPSDFIKDTFRNSLKFMFLTLGGVGANEILIGNRDRGIDLVVLTIYILIVLGFSYIPAFIILLREQIVSYQSFKMYSPKVIELDSTIRNMEHEKQAEEIVKLIPENQLNNREATLLDTIKQLEKQNEALRSEKSSRK